MAVDTAEVEQQTTDLSEQATEPVTAAEAADSTGAEAEAVKVEQAAALLAELSDEALDELPAIKSRTARIEESQRQKADVQEKQRAAEYADQVAVFRKDFIDRGKYIDEFERIAGVSLDAEQRTQIYESVLLGMDSGIQAGLPGRLDATLGKMFPDGYKLPPETATKIARLTRESAADPKGTPVGALLVAQVEAYGVYYGESVVRPQLQAEFDAKLKAEKAALATQRAGAARNVGPTNVEGAAPGAKMNSAQLNARYTDSQFMALPAEEKKRLNDEARQADAQR